MGDVGVIRVVLCGDNPGAIYDEVSKGLQDREVTSIYLHKKGSERVRDRDEEVVDLRKLDPPPVGIEC